MSPEHAASPQTPQTLAALLAQADHHGPSLPQAACAAARLAIAMAQAQGDARSEAQARFHLSLQLLRVGQYADVLKEATPALQAMAQPELAVLLQTERQELMRAYTMAASELGEFDRALDNAESLVRLVGPGGDATASVRASFTLAVCFERMGDSWQALRVLGDALQAKGPDVEARERLTMHNGLCALAIGLFHRLNGAAPAAEVQSVLARALEAGSQAFTLMPEPADPSQEVAICGNLAEVLTYQGEFARAQQLFKRAEASARAHGLVAHLWRLRASMAMWLLLQEQPAAALADIQLILGEMLERGDQAPPQTVIRAHHAAYRACRLLGRVDEALDHFEVVERLERSRAIQQLRAQSQLFVTRTEAQQAQWQAEQARQDALTQRARAAEFAASAERDALTGLGNRRHFDRRVGELLPVLQQASQPAALVLIDVDLFKHINDTHGHAVGDQVLVALAALLRENTRSRDVLARYGGEEFVMVLPGMGLVQAREVCERLRERVAASTQLSPAVPSVRATISLGLALSPPYDVERLLKSADDALYRAKSEGRNCLRVASPVLTADHAAVPAAHSHRR